jgi:hypothetical protein
MRPDSESSVRLAILSLFRLENPVLKGPELCFNPATYKPIPVVAWPLIEFYEACSLQLGIRFFECRIVSSFIRSISRDFLELFEEYSPSRSLGRPPKEQTCRFRGCARPSDNLSKHVVLQRKMIFHFKKIIFDDARLLRCCPDAIHSILTVRIAELKTKEVHLVSLSSLLAE